jgi:uncharacterized protein (DUF2141 family)
MNDAGDDYERMPIEQVDSILSQLRPEYWTPERLRSASPSDKRQAVRKAFTTTGRGKVRAGGTTTRYGRAAALIGYPTEGYALSNGIRAVIRRPRFIDAAFRVDTADMYITLHIKY